MVAAPHQMLPHLERKAKRAVAKKLPLIVEMEMPALSKTVNLFPALVR